MPPEQPLPHIHRISVPTPYAVGPVNCYLLDGPEPALVDTGPPTPDAEAALRAGLAAIAVPIQDIAQIVLTHHHPDHAGGLAWLLAEAAARRQAPVLLGHPDNDLWLLDRPDLLQSRLAFFAALYRYCGVEGDAAEAMRRRYADYDRPLSPRPVDVPLREGHQIDLAGARWQIYETPGHAGTHVALVRGDGTALVGDTLLERISSNALAEPPHAGQAERPSAMLAYRKTLRRLAGMPLHLLLPGHGPPFGDHAALIARRLAAHEERATRLLAGLAADHHTVLALAYFLFPGLPEGQLFLGISEVLGHLDILEEQGRARHSGEAPARYSAVP
jgi:glyoxylase-like metal-dependent hydrolase (beta-lactamase superfamily II)